MSTAHLTVAPVRLNGAGAAVKLCILVVALAVIARARVAVLPGWVVPFPGADHGR
jgi:hypothetical protein